MKRMMKAMAMISFSIGRVIRRSTSQREAPSTWAAS